MVQFDASEKRGDRGYVRVRGSLVGDVPVTQLRGAVDHYCTDGGVNDIVVDVSDVDQIGLEGVAVLLLLWRDAGRHGKCLVIERPHGQVREKLETTGVLRWLSADRTRGSRRAA